MPVSFGRHFRPYKLNYYLPRAYRTQCICQFAVHLYALTITPFSSTDTKTQTVIFGHVFRLTDGVVIKVHRRYRLVFIFTYVSSSSSSSSLTVFNSHSFGCLWRCRSPFSLSGEKYFVVPLKNPDSCIRRKYYLPRTKSFRGLSMKTGGLSASNGIFFLVTLIGEYTRDVRGL